MHHSQERHPAGVTSAVGRVFSRTTLLTEDLPLAGHSSERGSQTSALTVVTSFFSGEPLDLDLEAFATLAVDQCLCLFVADNFLRLGIPLELAAHPSCDPRQVARR